MEKNPLVKNFKKVIVNIDLILTIFRKIKVNLLKELTISNYALIDYLRVDLSHGFTSITGETGAGKSILLGGLSLALGKRADPSLVKDKTKKCFVDLVFSIENLRSS